MTAPAPSRRALVRIAAGVAGASAATAALGACVPRLPAPPPQTPPDRPVTSATLVGRTLRVYRTGDPLTRDYREDRANIELGPNGGIVSVWIG